MTAGVMIWLQEQYVAAGVKMWLTDKLLKSSVSGFCRIFRFFQIHGLLEPLYLVFFLLNKSDYSVISAAETKGWDLINVIKQQICHVLLALKVVEF